MRFYIIEKDKEYLKNNFKSYSLSIIDEYFLGLSTKENVKDILFGYRAFTEEEYSKAVEAILVGEPVQIYGKESVRSSVVNEAEGRRFRGVSILEEEITSAGKQTFTYTLAEAREIDGMRFKAYNAGWRDKISMSVIDSEGNELDTFVEGWHLDEPTSIKVYRAKLLAGLSIKLEIDVAEAPTEPLRVWCDAFLHKFPV